MELLTGLSNLFSFWGIIAFSAGIIIGFIIGVLPGLGTGTALMLSFPIVFLVPKEMAFICFAAMFGAADFGASVTSIILCTPGSVSNLVTVFDGYPMAKNGQASRALGLAAFSSIFGAIVGIIVLILAIPLVQSILNLYGIREFFWTVILSFIVVGLATASGSFLKGLAACCIGVLISFIGYSSFLGSTRFIGENLYLWDGIDLGPFIIGLFALSELLMLQARGQSISSCEIIQKANIKQTLASIKEAGKNIHKLTLGSIIGTIVGIIPGIGGSVACYLSYAAAKILSKKRKLFGQGSPEGLMASEVANNAKDGGALLTTLFFGLPGSAEMAIILGAFLVVGINPGPGMAEKNLDLVWLIIMATLFGNVASCLIVLLGSSFLSRITVMPISLVVAATVPISLTGLFVIRSNIWDVILAAIFCFFGFLLKRNGYPLAPLIIGFILGPLVEKSFHMTLKSSLYNPAGFFDSTWSVVTIILCIILLSVPFLSTYFHYLKRKRSVKSQVIDQDKYTPDSNASIAKEPILTAAMLIIISCSFIFAARGYEWESNILPLITAISAIIILIIILVSEASGKFAYVMEYVMGSFGQKGSITTDPKWSKLMQLYIWLMGLVLAIFLIGYVASILISVFILLRYVGRVKTPKSIIFAVIIDVFIYIIYGLIFSVRLWPGIIPSVIPGFVGGGSLPPF
ncbi:MAG: tripartite tricarboxylate transporter permease [Spirochaetes bacterium]|nr:tripartite tricarboxylate transporter permease [Spirochaetota bacterium]